MEAAERLAAIRVRVRQAAERVNRDPATVGLVAVSKRKPAAELSPLRAAGCRDFGENYVQELVDKAAALAEGPPIRWHFIGHLQRNKVAAVLAVPGLALIHGGDSERLLRALDDRATAPLDVLIQVDLAGEATKNGCSPDALPALLASARACARLRVTGLMAIPPAEDDPERSRPYFRRLRELRDEHGAGHELSMGMSHDFEVAIEEGATWVRVGTAIFGPRG